MANSTLNGIESASNTLIGLFTKIDEFAANGSDPRKHPDWYNFVRKLTAEYCSEIAAIIIFHTEDAASGKESFSFMLYPKEKIYCGEMHHIEKRTQATLQALKRHINKKILDFVRI